MSDKAPRRSDGWACLGLLAALAALAAVVYGTAQVVGSFWHGPTVATCGGKVMGPYDKCGSYRPGSSTPQTTSSATSQLHEGQFGHMVYVYLTSLGIVIAVMVVICFIVAAFNNRKGTANAS